MVVDDVNKETNGDVCATVWVVFTGVVEVVALDGKVAGVDIKTVVVDLQTPQKAGQ